MVLYKKRTKKKKQGNERREREREREKEKLSGDRFLIRPFLLILKTVSNTFAIFLDKL